MNIDANGFLDPTQKKENTNEVAQIQEQDSREEEES